MCSLVYWWLCYMRRIKRGCQDVSRGGVMSYIECVCWGEGVYLGVEELIHGVEQYW